MLLGGDHKENIPDVSYFYKQLVLEEDLVIPLHCELLRSTARVHSRARMPNTSAKYAGLHL